MFCTFFNLVIVSMRNCSVTYYVIYECWVISLLSDSLLNGSSETHINPHNNPRRAKSMYSTLPISLPYKKTRQRCVSKGVFCITWSVALLSVSWNRSSQLEGRIVSKWLGLVTRTPYYVISYIISITEQMFTCFHVHSCMSYMVKQISFH